MRVANPNGRNHPNPFHFHFPQRGVDNTQMGGRETTSSSEETGQSPMRSKKTTSTKLGKGSYHLYQTM